ncbi:MAG: hypothetical protein LUG52_10570 [Clostridia bacterium]|nr:hypothetical protein [Clostridia bacterium]
MRQEQSRRKTPAARILSLALALCMIAAFVPAVTLTAGAADDYNSTEYVISSNLVFDGSYSAVSGTPAGSSATDISNWYSDEDGTAWTQQYSTTGEDDDWTDPSGDQVRLGAVGHYSFYSALDGVETDRNVIKFQTFQYNWTNAYGKITMGDGYGVDNDILVFEWTDYDNQTTSTTYWNTTDTVDYAGVTLYDTEGTAVANVFLDINGSTFGLNDVADKEYSTFTTGTVYRISIVNDTDSATVYYEANTGSGFTTLQTDTLTAPAKGLGSFVCSRGYYNFAWNVFALGDLRIYAADFATDSTEGSVQIALDAIDNVPVRADETTGSFTLDTTVTDSFGGEFNVSWTSDSSVIKIDEGTAEVTPTDEVTYVTLTPTVQFDEDTTVTGATHTVVVFPASRAGDEYSDGSATYDIGDENLIETAGTAASFEDSEGNFSLDGWTTASGYKLSASDVTGNNYFFRVDEDLVWSSGEGWTAELSLAMKTAIPDGKYALGTRWGDGSTGLCTLHTFWEAKANTTYYFSFYTKDTDYASGAVIQAYLSSDNTCGAASYYYDNTYNSVTPTTEWKKYEYVFTTGDEAGYIAFYAYNLGGNGYQLDYCFDDFELYEATQKEEYLLSVNDVTAAVISGTEPVLPNTVTGEGSEGNTLTEAVTWDAFTENQFVNKTDEATEVDVSGTTASGFTATAKVTVYPLTYTLDDITCTSGSAYEELMQAAEGELVIEFDYTPSSDYSVYNQWIYISKDQGVFSTGAIGFGTDDDTSGHFNTKNSGTYLGYVTAGTTYHMLVETTVSEQTYTLTMASDGDNIWSNTDSYRASSTSLNTIVVSTNGRSSSFTLSNIKVYDPNCEVETYDVKYVDENDVEIDSELLKASDAETTYTDTLDNMKAYNDEITAPYVDIPTIEDYIFTSKSVSGTTITLAYTAVSTVDANSAFDNYFADVTDETTFVSLNMLGAHDAFTAGMDSDNIKYDAAGVAIGDSGSLSAAYWKAESTTVNASKTQTKSALELLESGVRYFDIRLSRSTGEQSGTYTFITDHTVTAPGTNGVFYTTHGILSDEFRPIAYTIGQWLKAHPGEVVVLDFQEVYDATISDGNATYDTYAAINDILEEAGINDFATYDYNTSIKTVTYGGLTDSGNQAGVVMFARQIGYKAGTFYARARAGIYDNKDTDGTGWEMGKLYSYYDDDNKPSEYKTSYIQTQVDALINYNDVDDPTGDHAAYHYARVMQAQSTGSSNLLTQAKSDHESLYTDLTSGDHADWLSALPIVMIDGVGADEYTSQIATLLQGCNVAQDVTVSYVVGNTTVATTTKSLMVGTIFVDETQYLIMKGSDGDNYYVTNAYTLKPYTCTTGEGKTASYDGSTVLYDITYVPSNKALSIPVTAVGDIFTVRPSSGSDTDANLYYSGEFNAYCWNDWLADDTKSRDRIGFATLTVPDLNSGVSNYKVTGTVSTNQWNTDYTVGMYIYAISEETFNSLDITTNESILTALEKAEVAYAWEVEDNQGLIDSSSIYLDSDVIEEVAGDSGKVVLIGISSRGLFGYGSDMEIEPETKDLGVTLVDGAQIRIGGGVDVEGKVGEDSGLRFIAVIEDTVETIAGYAKEEGVEGTFGIAIWDGGHDTSVKDGWEDENPAAKVDVTKYQDDEVGTIFTVAITNIRSDNYNQIYVAVPYVKITANGVDTYYYDFDEAVARTPYQVASGILLNSEAQSITGSDGTTYVYSTEAEAALIEVLNAYANMTGARLTLTRDTEQGTYTFAIAEYANSEDSAGAEAFFTMEVSEGSIADGYTITLTPIGDSAEFLDYADDYYRVNNAHDAFEDTVGASATVEEGKLIITVKGTGTATE